MLLESGERCRVYVPAFGLVAHEDRGRCAALEGFGGGGYERAVGVAVEKEGEEGAEGWEALSKFQSQRRL